MTEVEVPNDVITGGGFGKKGQGLCEPKPEHFKGSTTMTDEPQPSDETKPDRKHDNEFEFYQDAGGEWRWKFTYANGEPGPPSGEGYTRRRDAVRALWHYLEILRDPSEVVIVLA